MNERAAYARVAQHYTGIIAGLSPEDEVLVSEYALRRAHEMLDEARGRLDAEAQAAADYAVAAAADYAEQAEAAGGPEEPAS